MPIVTKVLLFTGFILAACSAAPAQTHDHGGAEPAPAAESAAANEFAGRYPVSFIERPPPLRPGIGRIGYPATTSSELARAYYDQGYAYLYLYHAVEAARAFHQALRFDPDMALAYIGLERAYRRMQAGDLARAAVERAMELAPLVGGRDQVRIRLAAAATEARGDEELRDAYLAKLDSVTASYPEDVEFRMLRALNASGEERIELLRAVLEVNPEHAGAHHELIHSHEVRREYDDAVAHGEILVRLAPAVAHARHMYGHNLMRVQRVPDAVREFDAADSLERTYFRMEGVPPEYDWHHPHNLHLLALTYWHQGRVAEAEAALRRRAELIQPDGSPMPWNRIALFELLLAEGRIEEVLEGAPSLTDSASEWVRMAGQLLTAEAFLLAGRHAEAEEILEASGAGAANQRVARTNQRLAGALMLTSDPPEGERMLRELVPTLREDRGPDGWIVSLMHLDAIASAARQADAWDLAVDVAKEMIDHDPSFARGYHALGLAADGAGDSETAERAFAEAARLWRLAGAGSHQLPSQME